MPSTAELAQDILDHSPRTYAFSFSPFLSSTYSHKLLNPSDAAHQNRNGTQQGQNHNHNAPNSSFNSLVCKHWLRGLCKKGTTCEFLHEYNLRKMPECNFFVRNGYCSNGDECLYLHIDPSSKLPPCPHYERGFCPLGPNCAKKHVRRKICSFYLAGFCPDGKVCNEGAHPRWRTDLGEPVAKTHVQGQREAFGTATGMAVDGARHHYGGGYHRDDADGDGQDMDAGSHRDRGFGRDHGRDRDRPRDGDHGGQRRWRGGRGGRGGRGNRRFKDRH